MIKKIFSIFILFILFSCNNETSSSSRNNDTGSIRAKDAIKHIGQHKTICGNVVNTTYASSSRGKPTFLNIDKSYPNHFFTIVIWGGNRYKFTGNPEYIYLNKNVCVEGTIDTYRGKAQIQVSNPSQIQIK